MRTDKKVIDIDMQNEEDFVKQLREMDKEHLLDAVMDKLEEFNSFIDETSKNIPLVGNMFIRIAKRKMDYYMLCRAMDNVQSNIGEKYERTD